MTASARLRASDSRQHASSGNLTVVARFAELVMQRVEALAPAGKRAQFEALTQQALHEAQALLGSADVHSAEKLPVSKLKVQDVIAQGWVEMSQATLYRAVEAGRFYCVTPNGRSTGKAFPVWQFIEPVPELMDAFSPSFARHPGSEIHAFWVTAVDAFNELSPAEVLAGKPFETRAGLHESQRALLALPAHVRVAKVKSVVDHQESMVDIVG